MRKLKLFKEYIILKHKGFSKCDRMLRYAMKGLITFEEFNNYYDKKVMKGGE